LTGNAKIILVDGAELTANGDYGNDGILVPAANSLTIYGQTLGTGKIIATGGGYSAGIGGDHDLTAGTISIAGGTVTAIGGGTCAGIGAASAGEGGTVSISGGTVSAIGGEQGGAGIGGATNGTPGSPGTINISGGTVTATGARAGAGIGGGGSRPGGNINISGGTILATGGVLGTGIGGGGYGAGGTISITGGTITANGGQQAAGIGGSEGNDGGTISITAGTVVAMGGLYGSGIGSGRFGRSGTINISGGTVSAVGRYGAAGLGAGYGANSDTINITGGTTSAEAWTWGNGIGAGNNCDECEGGKILISGNTTTVKARAGDIFDIGGSAAGTSTLSITGGAKVWLQKRGANAASATLQNATIYGTGDNGYTNPYDSGDGAGTGTNIWGVYGATTNSNLNSTGTISGPTLSYGTTNASKTITVKNNGLTTLSNVNVSFPIVTGELASSANAFELVNPTAGFSIPPLGSETLTIKPKDNLLALGGSDTYTYKNTATLSWTYQVNYGSGVTEQNHNTPASYEVIGVSGITITPANPNLNYLGTVQLSKTVAPSNAPNQAVNWSSSNTNIATVDSTGLVTSVGIGDVTITAKSTIYPTKYGTTVVHTVYQTPYTVHFELNSGSGPFNDVSMTTDIQKALPTYSGTKAGFNFIGWDTAPAGTTVVYQNGVNVLNLAAPGATKNLYAVWQTMDATTTDYYKKIAARWDTEAPEVINFCGYNWDIVGIHDGIGNNVGIGTTTNDNLPTQNVALLLDKSNTIVGTSIFGSTINYEGSTLQTAMNGIYSGFSGCAERADITDRNLTDVSSAGQHIWAVSVGEANQFSTNNQRLFPDPAAGWFTRTPGGDQIETIGSTGAASWQARGSSQNVRPALFLKLSSDAFAGYPIQFNLKSGSSNMENLLKHFDAPLKIPRYDGVKPGFRFIGWDTNSAATNVVYKDGGEITTDLTAVEDEIQTLYAVWKSEDATTTNFYNRIANNWNTNNPVTINYCGYKWNVVGINNGAGTNVGIGSTTDDTMRAGIATLLLDKSNTIVGTSAFGPNTVYKDSTLQTIINTTIYNSFSTCAERADIEDRDLTDLFNVTNQHLWALSYAEASQFSQANRLFPTPASNWWTRTPGGSQIQTVMAGGAIQWQEEATIQNVRPALFLDLSSAALTPNIDLATTYTVKYDLKSGGGSNADQTLTYGKGAVLNSYSGVKHGYTFEGWNSNTTCASDSVIASFPTGAWQSNNCETTQYAQGATVTNLSTTNGATVNLYAVWKAVDAASQSYYDKIAAGWDTTNPVVVNYCGFNWDVVGINDGSGNNVGIGTTTDDKLPIGNVALLLDKSNTIVGTSVFGPGTNYNGSTLQTAMNTTIYNSFSACSERADITDRDLPDVSVAGQHIWALSRDEGELLPKELRLFPNPENDWGVRTKGTYLPETNVFYYSNGGDLAQKSRGIGSSVRPALFLNLSSAAFNGYPNVAVTYPLKFDLKSGSSNMDDITMTWNKPQVISQYGGAKPGFRFIGWDTNSAGTNVVYKDGDIISTNLTLTEGDTQTLYAVWKPVDATTTNFYKRITNNWNTTNPVAINYCGFKWNVVGINDGTGNKVGVGTITSDKLPAGNVALLLDKSNTIVGPSQFRSNAANAYEDSILQTVMNDTIYDSFSTCAERADIIDRNLVDVGSAGQHIWPLSKTEAEQFSQANRLFPTPVAGWWTRTPQNTTNVYAVASTGGLSAIARNTSGIEVRPALFLDISSLAITPNIDFATTYTIHYDLKSGGGSNADQTLTYGKGAAFNTYSGEKYGYTFSGWNSNATCALDAVIADAPGGAWLSNDCEATKYAQGATVTNLSTTNGATVNMYAVWKDVRYTVKFNLQSGSGLLNDITMTTDVAKALPNYSGTKSGFRFVGWDTNSAGTTVVYKDGTKIATNLAVPGATTTLYAVWQAVDATTTNYYNHIVANWNTDNPTTINYCGYKWNVVGINSGTGEKVGIGTAGATTTDGTGLPVGNVTLLLDRSNTIVENGYYNPSNSANSNYYDGSNMQNVLNTTIYGMLSGCSERSDIAPRTLVGESNNYGAASNYNDDHIAGPTLENQNLWPLSASEALMIGTNNQRVFPQSSPGFWKLRTPGNIYYRVSVVNTGGVVNLEGGSVPDGTPFRPALYLDISSAAITPNIDYKPYYIHFDTKSGDNAPGDETVSYGKPANLTSYSGEKYGYTFEGWNSNTICASDPVIASFPTGAWQSNNCDTTKYVQGATVTNLSTTNGATVSLYAVWKEKVTNITTDPTETSITYGQTGRLDYTITTQPTFDGVTWSSSNDAIASVNASGLVTGVAVGDATITVKSTTNTNKYATTTVHIVPQPETAPTLSIDWANETVTGFDTNSSGFKVAQTEAGLTTCAQLSTGVSDISGVIAGTSKTLWTKKCPTDTNHSDSPATSIAIPARPVAPVITTPGGVISDVTSNMEYNATGVNFAGSWTAIAGTTIPGLTNGTYYIRDKAVNTGGSEHFKSSAATVVLQIPVSGVTVAPTSTTITYGETAQLTETVAPADAYVQTVTWSSSNTNVATVNASGLVTSKSAGDATITAKSTSDQTKFGTTVVTVDKKPLTVSIGSVVIPDRPFISGTITAPVTGVVVIDSGIVNSDVITVSRCTGSYSDDVAGVSKPVDLTCTLSGTKASSYTIVTYPSVAGTILDYKEVNLAGYDVQVPTDAIETAESAPGAGDAYITLPNADPEYEIFIDDVSIIVPGGSVIYENGTVTVPPGTSQEVTMDDETSEVPGSSVVNPGARQITVPAGDVIIQPNAAITVPNGSVVNPGAGTITLPAGTVIANGVSVVVPANSIINAATGIITLPTGKVAVTQTKGSENLSLSSATITQGKTVTITGSGFTPNELVRLELHAPTKILSASVTVNASGKFSLTKTVTTATAVGVHQVVAYDKTSGIQLKSTNLKVVKPAPPKPVSAKVKKAKGAITFIWGSSGLLTTVEIYYRVKGTSKWKIVRVSSADRKKIKLKRKKTYQFQLRSYKSVNGKNYYSTWTKKTVKL
jgi:hypothetical protein